MKNETFYLSFVSFFRNTPVLIQNELFLAEYDTITMFLSFSFLFFSFRIFKKILMSTSKNKDPPSPHVGPRVPQSQPVQSHTSTSIEARGTGTSKTRTISSKSMA